MLVGTRTDRPLSRKAYPSWWGGGAGLRGRPIKLLVLLTFKEPVLTATGGGFLVRGQHSAPNTTHSLYQDYATVTTL
jgi:hypothetical protein